ncbi:MAG TPA: acyl carrier protein [Candidatus Limnocylindria bacterium]|nr:acyl carrier protein [Candidatus Limnocylindria bacterium]
MSVFPLDAGRLPAAEPDGESELGTVQPTLVGIVQKLFRVPNLRLALDTRYADIPGWDSLSHVNVIFGIEESFGIRFDDDELDQLRAFSTLGELEGMIRRKLPAGTRAQR